MTVQPNKLSQCARPAGWNYFDDIQIPTRNIGTLAGYHKEG